MPVEVFVLAGEQLEASVEQLLSVMVQLLVQVVEPANFLYQAQGHRA